MTLTETPDHVTTLSPAPFALFAVVVFGADAAAAPGRGGAGGAGGGGGGAGMDDAATGAGSVCPFCSEGMLNQSALSSLRASYLHWFCHSSQLTVAGAAPPSAASCSKRIR